MSQWLWVSKAAKRRLLLLAASGSLLVLAAGLTLAGLRDSISYFYTPSRALSQARVRTHIQLGGLVERGSLRSLPGGGAAFTVVDRGGAVQVVFHGPLPDLFREGQAVVANGVLIRKDTFLATAILAKHDERYVPRSVAALERSPSWRRDAVAER